jgi:ribosomal protein S27E
MKTPTPTTYAELVRAYDFLNRRLYRDELPECMLTLQRKNERVNGFFAPGRFVEVDGAVADELAMNPVRFGTASTRVVLSTLAHEQAHVWQHHFGKPGRGKYHNKEWGAKMKEIGLYPSNTGKPGGKETGDQMTHYIIEGGPFDRAAQELMRGGFRFSWAEDSGEGREAEGVVVAVALEPEDDKSNRTKFTCPSCEANAWGKPSLNLICGLCQLEMLANSRGGKKAGRGELSRPAGQAPAPLA